MTNKVTVMIGNISGYAYLIHYALTKSVKVYLLQKTGKVYVDLKRQTIMVIIELMITILLSLLYNSAKNHRKKKKERIYEL